MDGPLQPDDIDQNPVLWIFSCIILPDRSATVGYRDIVLHRRLPGSLFCIISADKKFLVAFSAFLIVIILSGKPNHDLDTASLP